MTNFLSDDATFKPGGGGGGVNQVNTGTGLTGGPITNTGTISLADVPTGTVKGRLLAGTGAPTDLTGTQATTLLDVFTTSLKGVVPASGGGTTNFLRADGTFAVPPGGGGGGVPAGGTTSQQLYRRNVDGAAIWHGDEVNVADFYPVGYVAPPSDSDPQFLTLTNFFGGSLVAAQAVYPLADDLKWTIDTFAIQSAIDYAYANNIQLVRILGGIHYYVTSAPIFNDYPTSMRNIGVYPRWTPTGTFSSGDICQYNGQPFIALRNISVVNGNVGVAPFFLTRFDVHTPGGSVALDPTRHGGITSNPACPGPVDPNWEFYYANVSARAMLGNVSGFVSLVGTDPAQSPAEIAHGAACISPLFHNAPAYIEGPLNSGGCISVSIVNSPYAQLWDNLSYPNGGSGQGYQGGQNPNSIGLVKYGGGQGSRCLWKNCGVTNRYTAFMSGGGIEALGDSNIMDRCIAAYVHTSWDVHGNQAVINEAYNCNFGGALGLKSPNAVKVYDGNWSPTQEHCEAYQFAISGTSAITITQNTTFSVLWGGSGAVSSASQNRIQFSTTVAFPDTLDTNPDQQLNKIAAANLYTMSFTDGRAGVYNSFAIMTQHFGIIPLLCTGFVVGPPIVGAGGNSGGNPPANGVMSFDVWPPWVAMHLGGGNNVTKSLFDLEAEIQAATTLYAAEMYRIFGGGGVDVFGMFVESIDASVCVFNGSGSQQTSSIRGLVMDSDLTLGVYNPVNGALFGGVGTTAQYFIQSTFPMFYPNNSSGLTLTDAVFFTGGGPLNVDVGVTGRFEYRNVVDEGSIDPPRVNMRFPITDDPFAGTAQTPSSNQTRSGTFAGGFVSDRNPNYIGLGLGFRATIWNSDGGNTPTMGLRPDPSRIPFIRSEDIAVLADSGNPPALSAQPAMFGSQVYQTCPWDFQTNGFSTFNGVTGNSLVESNHSWWSWMQDLNTTNVPGLTWECKGQSWCLYMNQAGLTHMCSGLVIGITTDVLCYYLVTGVYPYLKRDATYTGYVTLYNIGGPNGTGTAALTDSAHGVARPAWISGIKSGVGSVYNGTVLKAMPYRIRLLRSPPALKTSNSLAIVGQTILASTLGGPWTLTLPLNPQPGDQIVVQDVDGAFGPNNVTVSPNGGKINNSTSNLVLRRSDENVTFTYKSSSYGWKAVETFLPSFGSIFSATDAAINGYHLSNGNSTASFAGGGTWWTERGTTAQSTGMLYVEFRCIVPMSSTNFVFGFTNAAFTIVSGSYPGFSGQGIGFWLNGSATFVSGSFANPGGVLCPAGAAVVNDVYALAIDVAGGKLWMAKNNVYAGGGVPSTGTNPSATFTIGTTGALLYAIGIFSSSDGAWTVQPTLASQTYAPPTGFTEWG